MAGRQAPRLCPLCKHPPEDTFQCLRSGRRCRKMINHPVCPSISRSALCGANSWLFVALAKSNQLLAYFTHRLPTALPSPLSSVFSEEEGFAVISQCYEPTLLRSYPKRLTFESEVPNRGVDWSSRPRRACYPWGNFSVTSGPQQWGL